MSRNGYMAKSELAKITKATNGEQAYLRKDAARAFLAMNYESERRFGVTLRVSSARTAYRPIADQNYFWRLYITGRGNLAARPGTSNHGLGLAVDLADQQMINIVNQIGEKYGFAKKWSDAPTENWHFKWRVGVYHAVTELYNYTAAERRWILQYDQLKRANKNLARRRVLRRVMAAKALAIKAAAKAKGGMKVQSRQARYNSLRSRSA